MIERWKTWRAVRAARCRISEESGGLFIGRRHCGTHNIVWDDGGICPGLGDTNPLKIFTFARDLGTGRH